MLQRDETSNMAGRLWIGTMPLRRTCLAGPSNVHVLPCPARAAITSASYQTASTLASGADKLVGVASNADFISQAEFEHGLRGQGLSFQDWLSTLPLQNAASAPLRVLPAAWSSFVGGSTAVHAHRSFSSDNLMISFVAHALLAADEPTRQAVSRALLAQELVDAEHLGMLVSILHLSRMGHSAEYAKMCVATLREQREKEKLSDATRKEALQIINTIDRVRTIPSCTPLEWPNPFDDASMEETWATRTPLHEALFPMAKRKLELMPVALSRSGAVPVAAAEGATADYLCSSGVAIVASHFGAWFATGQAAHLERILVQYCAPFAELGASFPKKDLVRFILDPSMELIQAPSNTDPQWVTRHARQLVARRSLSELFFVGAQSKTSGVTDIFLSVCDETPSTSLSDPAKELFRDLAALMDTARDASEGEGQSS